MFRGFWVKIAGVLLVVLFKASSVPQAVPASGQATVPAELWRRAWTETNAKAGGKGMHWFCCSGLCFIKTTALQDTGKDQCCPYHLCPFLKWIWHQTVPKTLKHLADFPFLSFGLPSSLHLKVLLKHQHDGCAWVTSVRHDWVTSIGQTGELVFCPPAQNSKGCPTPSMPKSLCLWLKQIMPFLIFLWSLQQLLPARFLDSSPHHPKLMAPHQTSVLLQTLFPAWPRARRKSKSQLLALMSWSVIVCRFPRVLDKQEYVLTIMCLEPPDLLESVHP